MKRSSDESGSDLEFDMASMSLWCAVSATVDIRADLILLSIVVHVECSLFLV